MKKLIGMLLVMILVFCCGLAFAEDNSCSHSWSGWTTVKEATCTASGTQRRICSECGTHEDKAIPASGHSWSGWTTVSEASCIANGTQRRICSDCGTHEDKTISASGHSWSGWTTIKESTCTDNGAQRRICSECGTHEDKAIPAKGHTAVSANNAVAATCTTAGKEADIVCSVCKATVTTGKAIPAKGHTAVSANNAVAATCTTAGKEADTVCSVCRATIATGKAIPAKGHTEVVDAAVAATCTETGLTEGKHCSVCKIVLVKQETVPAKGHTIVADAAVAATCTETGLTEGKHCSVCKTVLVKQETIPAKGHTIVADVAVAATCTETGLTAGEHCSVCNYKVDQEVVPAKGHTEVIDAAIAATCTQSGLTEGKHCSECSETLVPQVEVQATGHDYKTVTRKPTTTSRGYDKHTCKVCGHEYRDNFKAKLQSPTSAPTEAPALVMETLGEFGTIVFDVNGVGVQYTTEWEVSEAVEDEAAENILIIIATQDENNLYGLCELHLSFELIDQLKEKNVDVISFVVGNAELMTPISMFDDEMLLVVKEDLEAPVGYVLTVDPNATNDAGEPGCLVKMEIITEDERFDVAEIVSGMILYVADVEINIFESTVYVPTNTGNTAK